MIRNALILLFVGATLAVGWMVFDVKSSGDSRDDALSQMEIQISEDGKHVGLITMREPDTADRLPDQQDWLIASK